MTMDTVLFTVPDWLVLCAKVGATFICSVVWLFAGFVLVVEVTEGVGMVKAGVSLRDRTDAVLKLLLFSGGLFICCVWSVFKMWW